ncbi:hypothetical protein GCM10023310_65490 [Paenibacillus vulneris]|uniref:Uncharacterized protein n=1 Tax=Paenibacillus vulneris TaxID=1133364 RepID=A0ABW3UI47_9BACL|nr:hypothetical protein [Paenibacillus sp. OAS669]MBE1442152.1 curved DNA-binding protein CbpA [Paenibacillus sp. OAS669]
MDKEQARKQVRAISDATDVLNTPEELEAYNQLIEESERTTPETCRASLDGN